MFLINDKKQIQRVYVGLKDISKPECDSSISYYD